MNSQKEFLSGTAAPGSAAPGSAEPGSAEPGSAEPGTAEPGSAERLLGPGTAERLLGAPPQHLGAYSRGYLPHRDYPGLLQFITYRLADSLPKGILEQLGAHARRLPAEKQDATLRKWIDEKLDAGSGACILREPQAAACVLENWRRFARERYDLIAWVVMPNHVHVLIRVYEGAPLAKIIQSWKSYTGKRIAAMIVEKAPRVGDPQTHRPRFEQVWMRDYWDRYIRDEKHFAAVIAYIHRNPVKAGLVERAEDWPWSSARDYWEQRDTWDGR